MSLPLPREFFSIVIPVHNEDENIAPLLREICAALNSAQHYEIIYVDDGSTDGTARRLRELRERFPRLRVISQSERCGQSTALLSGIKAARFPWIVTLDGDGQNDPADIPKLLAGLHKSGSAGVPRLVIGHRARRRDSRLRRLSSRIANSVRSRLLKDHTQDTGCGLKAFSHDAYLALPRFDHMHRFLPALFLREGGEVIPVDVVHRSRSRGHSKYGVHNRLWVGITDLFGVMWLQRRFKQVEVTEDRG